MRERRFTIRCRWVTRFRFPRGSWRARSSSPGSIPALVPDRTARGSGPRAEQCLSLDLDRLGELAAEVIEDDEAARTVVGFTGWTPSPGSKSPAAPRRRRHRYRKVDDRNGSCPPARDHRVTSTDFIRQTMRAFFSEVCPRFTTRASKPGCAHRAEEEESGDAAILGFLDQTRNVLVGVHAALERAATEHWSTVLRGPPRPRDGRHGVPGRLRRAMCRGDRGREPAHRAISGCATRRPTGYVPSKASTRCLRSGRSRST